MLRQALALLVLLCCRPGWAVETRVPVERLAPPPGGQGLWAVEDASVAGRFRVLLDFGWSVSGGSLTLTHAERSGDNNLVADPVRRMGAVQLSFALELWRQLRLGLALPLLVPQGQGLVGLGGSSLPAAAVSDLRLHSTVALLQGNRVLPIRVALAAILSLPTGDDSGFAGLGAVAFEPRMLVTVQPHRLLMIRSQLGVALHDERELFGARWGNRLTWGVAGELRLSWIPVVGRHIGVVGEVDGTSCAGCGMAPLELRAGLRLHRPRWNLSVGAGGGVGDAATTPSWRVLGAVGTAFGR